MVKMTGLFVFDQQNDIIFTQLNGHIRKKLYEIAKKQELLPDNAVCFLIFHFISANFKFSSNKNSLFLLVCVVLCCVQVENDDIDTNVMVQLFSPIVASQRIMFCQFDNSYTSIQLDDDLNFVFEEVRGMASMKTKIV